MFLSIIIPVYNVEKYLNACLESVCKQNGDYEVIVVNDGSPDNSVEIARKYEQSYPALLRVIEQENQGLSGARNTGARAARGEYLWFVDSDDTIAAGAVARLREVLTRERPDILCFDVDEVSEATGEHKRLSCLCRQGYEHLYGRLLREEEQLDYGYFLHLGVSQKNIFSKSFFSRYNLFFVRGIIHEDVEQSLRAFMYARTVYLLREQLYVYLNRTSGSIMSSKNIRSIQCKITIVNNWWMLLRDESLTKRQRRMVYNNIFYYVYEIFASRSKYGRSEYAKVMPGNSFRLWRHAVVSAWHAFFRMSFGRRAKVFVLVFAPYLIPYLHKR